MVCSHIYSPKPRMKMKFGNGLQLLGKVRLTETDETQAWLKSIQLAQNKMTRFLNGTLVKTRSAQNQ